MEGASPACGHARAVGWQAHASATRAPTCVHGDVIASDNLCGSRDYQCANQGWPKSPERHLVEHPLGPHIYLKLTIRFYCGRPRTIFFREISRIAAHRICVLCDSERPPWAARHCASPSASGSGSTAAYYFKFKYGTASHSCCYHFDLIQLKAPAAGRRAQRAEAQSRRITSSHTSPSHPRGGRHTLHRLLDRKVGHAAAGGQAG